MSPLFRRRHAPDRSDYGMGGFNFTVNRYRAIGWVTVFTFVERN
jgi:hypothetical protein